MWHFIYFSRVCGTLFYLPKPINVSCLLNQEKKEENEIEIKQLFFYRSRKKFVIYKNVKCGTQNYYTYFIRDVKLSLQEQKPKVNFN